MRALAGFLGLTLLVALALAAPATQEQMSDASQFFREPNYTINYSKIPWVLRGVTPKLQLPTQYRYDVVLPPPPVPKIDPRTCPGEFALCYQVRTHNSSENFTYGRNYTATSSYVFPERRIKTFVCVGNDTACAEEATSCYCPPTIPDVPVFIGASDRCSDTAHLCRNTETSLVLCNGNITSCRERYLECGCGRYATCTASTRNTCINGRNEFILCTTTLVECLKKYPTCFCGDTAQYLQQGCTTLRHNCTDGGRNVTCRGAFTDCALKHDACTC